MHLFRITILILFFVNNSYSQSLSFNKLDSNLASIKFDSLVYDIDLNKYKPVLLKKYDEKKQEEIKIEITEKLSTSSPVLLDDHLILLQNNGSCYAFDITSGKRNSSLEMKLNIIKLDRIIQYDNKLCGCQLNDKKYLNGRFNNKSDNKFLSFNDNLQWNLDTNLKEEMFDMHRRESLQYKDEFLSIYSSYSHYFPNTRVELANQKKFKFEPHINSIVNKNGTYFALTNREFMETSGPSIYQLVNTEGDHFNFIEKYQICRISIITSFSLNNSIIYLCKKGELNFLCEFESGHFYYNSSFPVDPELDFYTYNVYNQNNIRVFLSKAVSPFYIIEQNKVVTITLNDH